MLNSYKQCEFCGETTNGIRHSNYVCKKCWITFKRLRNIHCSQCNKDNKILKGENKK